MARDLLSVASDMQGMERVLLSVTRDLLFGKGSGKCGVRLVGEGSVRSGKGSAKSVSGFFLSVTRYLLIVVMDLPSVPRDLLSLLRDLLGVLGSAKCEEFNKVLSQSQ